MDTPEFNLNPPNDSTETDSVNRPEFLSYAEFGITKIPGAYQQVIDPVPSRPSVPTFSETLYTDKSMS